MIPNQEIIDEISQLGDKIYFIVDNYGSGISTKVMEIEDVLKEHHIRHTIRNYTAENPHCGGWVDFGSLRERKFNSQSEIEHHFSKCAVAQKLHFCFPITGSEMWPCAPARRRKELGLSDDYSEYIDLLDDSLSIEEQREKIKAIFEKRSLSACAYCVGLCDNSERFTPGEQLTEDELKCIRSGAKSYLEVKAMMKGK